MYYPGWKVCVTGAGGSIGSVLVRRLVDLGANVRGIARSEESLLRIPSGARQMLGSITDASFLAEAFAGQDTVFHCAAHKHVSICEANPDEARFNNICGTDRALYRAMRAGVNQFIFLSTDKAFEPSCVYGETKQAGERLVIEASKMPHPMNCKIVRLCNVLDSSGSVIPIWRKQIEAGGPVTVSSPYATRYFISMEEAVTFLIGAQNMDGIGPHVPDWVKPTRIIDLARMVIAARTPYGVEIKITGMKPGEKLHETLTAKL